MMRRAGMFAALALAVACARPAPPTPSAAPPSATASAAPAATVAASAPPAADAAPQPLVMVDEPLSLGQPERAKTSLFVRGYIGAGLSPDGRFAVLVPSGRGATLRKLGSGKEHALKAGLVERSAFSTDSAFVALDDEGGSIHVFETATGRFVQSNRGDHPKFIDGKWLGLRRGCEGFVVDVTRAATPQRLGKACGKVIHTSADFRTWVVAEPANFRLGVLQAYERVHEVNLSGGAKRTVVQGSATAAIFEPTVSPDGRWLCFLQADFSLSCSTLRGPVSAETLHDGNVLRNPVFDDAGKQLLFGVGKSEHAPRDVFVADLDGRRVRRLLSAEHEWWDFLPGGQRIVGHGGKTQLTIYDIPSGRRIVLGARGEEWEGVFLLPGRADRFLAGRERGGTRDLFWVDLAP